MIFAILLKSEKKTRARNFRRLKGGFSTTLPETISSHLKMDGWKTSLETKKQFQDSGSIIIFFESDDVYPSSSRAPYIWNQAPPVYQVTLHPFQICWELEDEGAVYDFSLPFNGGGVDMLQFPVAGS